MSITTRPPRHEATGCAALALAALFGAVCFLIGVLVGLAF